MEEMKDALSLLDLNPRPAFCVKDGIIIKTNSPAAVHMIRAQTPIADLLDTGAEEYAALSSGCLYLSLNVSGQILGASVTRIKDFDIFCVEQDEDNIELRTMARVSQEMRKPLGDVIAIAAKIFPVCQKDEDPQTRQLAAHLNQGIFQILRTINNMSDANRYTTDPFDRMEYTNICAVLDEIFEKAAAHMEHIGVNLQYTGFPEQVDTMVSREKLEHAVFNIICNCVEHASESKTIHARLTRRNNKLYLSVQDSGNGIPQDLRGSIYSMYTQEPGIRDGRMGLGLGMVLIRAAATAHGGTVLVDHPNGIGTRVTVSFSIASNSVPEVHTPRIGVDYTGGRDSMLLDLANILPVWLYDPN